MKWFKHFSDSYTNLKHQDLIEDFGLEGYGLRWLLVELIAQQGENFEIKREKNWKKLVRTWTGLEEERLEVLLQKLGNLNIIDKKRLKQGVLAIPKMAEYADEYTARVGRVSGEYRDSVGLEQNRLDKKKIRIDGGASKEAGEKRGVGPRAIGELIRNYQRDPK